MKKIKIVAAMLLAANLNYTEAQNLLVGLQACYPLDNNANNMASTGAPLNGTPFGVTATMDRFFNPTGAYAFSGSPGSYVSLPNNPLLKPNTISFSAWVNFNSVSVNQLIVFTQNNCVSFYEGYALAATKIGPTFRLQLVKSGSACSAATQQILTGATNLITNTWYHVGFYMGNDSLKLFLNGVPDVAPVPALVPFAYSSAPVILGGSNTVPNYPFIGAMDAVRFYNRKLGNNEFYQLATSDPVCAASLTDGLEACYPLDCDSINYAPATMSSPPSLNGTRYNLVCDTGHTGALNTAYKFAGNSTSYMKLPNDVRIKSTYGVSFSAWAKLDANVAAYQYIVFAKNTCPSYFEGYTLVAAKSGSQIKYQVVKANSSTAGCGPQAILNSINNYSPFTWHHVVFYVDNAFVKLYVDGVLDNVVVSPIQLNYDLSGVILGGTNQSYNYPLNGSIDNVRIYNRELTQSEITNIYLRDPACNSKGCIDCKEEQTVGLQGLNLSDTKIEVFPNPSSGKFYIRNAKNNAVVVYDVNGKIVQHSITQVDETTGEINLMNATEGLYFVKIMDASGKAVQTSKIVVTH